MTQPTPNNTTELRDFMLAVRNALLIVVRYIEKRYMDNKTTTQTVGFGAPDSSKP